MQKEILSFLSVCRTIVFYERIEEEVELYRGYQNLPQKEFDIPEYKNLSDTYQNFSKSFDEMIGNYLDHAYSDLFIKLVETLSSKNSAKKLVGIEKSFTQDEVSNLLSQTYEKILQIYREGVDDDVEDQLFFINIITNILNSKTDDATDLTCPYCGKTPDIVEAADFFGEDSKYDGKRVCCCECGAYALVNSSGDIIGTMADKELHDKRNRVRSIMSQFNEAAGSLYYETRSRVANLIGKDSLNKYAVDYFSAQECNKVIHSLLEVIKKIKTTNVSYPKCHRDLMTAIQNGTRLRIVKDLSAKRNKRLLVPMQVGTSSFTVQVRGGGTETFTFPKGLDYRFEGETFKIVHPSGNVDEYKLYPQEFRNIPF